MLQIKTGQTLLFTGDSITDCGRSYPLGAGSGLGNGYVKLIDCLLASSYPKTAIRILNTGINGNRVTDLRDRWQKDTQIYKPDWLSFMIGINDVWRQFDTPDDLTPVTPEQFEATYRELLQNLPKKTKPILATPFLIESKPTDPMRAMMDTYGSIVKKLAAKFNAHLVDTQAAFDTYLKYRPSETLAEDRVHPNQTGHLILAKAFLDSIGFDWKHNRS